MPYFQVLSPDQEVLGSLIISYKQAINNEHFDDIYRKHGVDNLDPAQWYPYQILMDVFNDIVALDMGVMMDFVSIGMNMTQGAALPPGIDQLSLTQILPLMNGISKLNTRGSDTGYVKTDMLTEHHATITVRSALPDDVMYGVFYGITRAFLPKGTHFTVYYDETAPHHDDGAEATVLHIKWE